MDPSTKCKAYYECYYFAFVVVLVGVRTLRCCSPANLLSQPQQHFAVNFANVKFALKKGRYGMFHRKGYHLFVFSLLPDLLNLELFCQLRL
jgi:hypothetical protein